MVVIEYVPCGDLLLPEEEPGIERHILQEPGCEAQNKPDVTAAPTFRVADSRRDELSCLKQGVWRDMFTKTTSTPRQARWIMARAAMSWLEYTVSRDIHYALNTRCLPVSNVHLVTPYSFQGPPACQVDSVWIAALRNVHHPEWCVSFMLSNRNLM